MALAAQKPATFGTYLSDVQRTPLLTADDEKDLADRIRSGDREARDWMVRANLRLVVNIARSYAGRGVPLEDLVAEGNMGLLRAVEGFEPTMNTRFATYASFWINQSIKRGIVNSAKTIRIPAYLSRLLGKWSRAANQLTDEMGRPPTNDEIAVRLGLSKKLSKVVADTVRIVNVPQDRGDDLGLAETVTDARAQKPGAAMSGAAELERVLNLIEGLDRRDATVLRMRYGLNGEPPKTLKEIGELMGLTRERIRQIETEALAKMHERF